MRESQRIVVRILVCLSLSVVSAGPAAAQTTGLANAGTGVGLVFVQQWKAPGFGIDFSKEVAKIWNIRSLDLVGELTWTHAQTHNDTDIVGGVRYVRHSKVLPTPFAQVLVGLNHEGREDGGRNDFRFQPGGGYVIPLPGKNIFLRAQNDYPFVFTTHETIIYLRFSFGVEIHLE